MSKTCTIGHPLHFGHFPFHAASSLFHTRESSSSLGITHQKGNPQRVLSTNLLGGREYDMKRSSLIYEPSVRYFYCHIQALYMNLTRGAAKGWGSLDTASRSDTSTLECYKTRLPLPLKQHNYSCQFPKQTLPPFCTTSTTTSLTNRETVRLNSAPPFLFIGEFKNKCEAHLTALEDIYCMAQLCISQVDIK